MKRSTNTDVLVIGGGAIGVCSAYYLNQAGRSVTLIERGDICSGSSYGNAGLIVPSHSIPLAAPGVIAKGLKWMLNPESPFYIKLRFDRQLISWLWKFRKACSETQMRRAIPVIRELNFASLRLYDELAGIEDLDFGYEKRGMAIIFRTEKGFQDGIKEARLMEKNGIETRVLKEQDVDDMANTETSAVGGVYYPQDAHINPHRYVQGLADYAAEKGVDVRTSTEVLAFESSGGRVNSIKTTRGDFSAEEIVLAGGTWSGEIAKNLGINLLIQPAKGYSGTFKRTADCPDIPFGLAESKVVLTPMGDTMRIAGTLELAGLDQSVNMRRVQAVLKSIPAYFPEIDSDALELLEIWRGLRPCTPDGLPYLGRSQQYDNLTIAAGHAMIGMSLSPITGKLVSQIVTREKPQIDLTPFRIERFA